MALSANTPRAYELGEVNTFGVKQSVEIYVGSAIGSSSGYARALTAGDDFLGFSLERKTGGASDGLVTVDVQSKGLVQLSVTSVAITDIGKPVWASDDGTFALTSNSGANSFIGSVHRFVSSGVAVVAFDASQPGMLTGVTELTDNSGGSANNTVESVAAATTLTDSSGYSGTHNDTVAAMAAITTLTDNTGLSGSHNDTLEAVTTFTASTPWNGSSVYPSAADEAAIAAAITALNQNASDTGQKVIELVARELVAAQNISNVSQKIIEIVTWQAAVQNNIADLTAKVNELIRARQ